MSYNYDINHLVANIEGGGLASSAPMWSAAQSKLNTELDKRKTAEEKYDFLHNTVFKALTTALQKTQKVNVTDNELKSINLIVNFINTKIATLATQNFSNAATRSACCNQFPEELHTKQVEAQKNYIKRSLLNAVAVCKQSIRTQYSANAQEKDRRMQEVDNLVTAFDFENLEPEDFEQLFDTHSATRSRYRGDMLVFVRDQFATRREAIATALSAMPEERRRQFQIPNDIRYSQLVLLQKATLYVARNAPQSAIPIAPPVPEGLIPVAPPVPEFELVQPPQEQVTQLAQQPPQLPTTKPHTFTELERQPTLVIQDIPPITKPPVLRQDSTQVTSVSTTIPEAPPVPTIIPVQIPQQPEEPDALTLIFSEQTNPPTLPTQQQAVPQAQVQTPRVETEVVPANTIPDAPTAPILDQRTPSPTAQQTASRRPSSPSKQEQQKEIEAAVFDAEALARIRALRRAPTMDEETEEDDDLDSSDTASSTSTQPHQQKISLPQMQIRVPERLQRDMRELTEVEELAQERNVEVKNAILDPTNHSYEDLRKNMQHYTNQGERNLVLSIFDEYVNIITQEERALRGASADTYRDNISKLRAKVSTLQRVATLCKTKYSFLSDVNSPLTRELITQKLRDFDAILRKAVT